MAFCSKCGAQIDDNATFCPQCGTKVGAADTTRANNTSTSNASEKVNAAVDTVKDKLTNTKDHTAEFDAADINDNKVMAILAYLAILVLVPIFAAKESKYAKFHSNQGIIFCVISIVFNVICKILCLFPVIDIIGYIVWSLGGIALFIVWLLAIINVANGKAKELPFVGGIEILK